MNREEARYYLQSSGFSEEQIDTIEKAFTSTDAISRQAVIDLLHSKFADGFGSDRWWNSMSVLYAINKVPPVNPTKTGHWIEHPEIETSAPEYLMFYECSECGDKQCFCKSDIHKKRFCGNCGCRMEEPQESEDDEQIKVGTKVRTIKDKDFAGEEVFPVETIGIVEEIRKGGKLPYIIRANSDYWYYSRDMFEVIEDIEPQESEDKE